jgi:hypothetical protein
VRDPEPTKSIPPPPPNADFSSTILRERERCLAAIMGSDDGKARINSYARVLDALIVWSLERPELEHKVHPGVQDTFKFVLRGTEQVIWEVFPDPKRGAKLIALPKPSLELPKAVQDEVRSRWKAIDLNENSGIGEARVRLPTLFSGSGLRTVQASIEWVLTTLRQ